MVVQLSANYSELCILLMTSACDYPPIYYACVVTATHMEAYHLDQRGGYKNPSEVKFPRLVCVMKLVRNSIDVLQ